MYLPILKVLSLFFSIIFLLYVLAGLYLMSFKSTYASAPRGQARQNDDFGCLILIGLFLMLLSFLIWPIERFFRKEGAWWTGWWKLSSYAVLGVCLLLVGWFL